MIVGASFHRQGSELNWPSRMTQGVSGMRERRRGGKVNRPEPGKREATGYGGLEGEEPSANEYEEPFKLKKERI